MGSLFVKILYFLDTHLMSRGQDYLKGQMHAEHQYTR